MSAVEKIFLSIILGMAVCLLAIVTVFSALEHSREMRKLDIAEKAVTNGVTINFGDSK
jgi:hypothetical protein